MLTGLLVLILWTSPAIGQGLAALESLLSGSSSGDGPGSLLPLMIKGVGLTSEQSDQVKDILAARRKTLRSLFKQLRLANEELADKLFVPNEVSAQELQPSVQKITQLREKLLQEGLQTVLEVRQILTPEQRAKAARLKEHIEALHTAMSGLLGEKSVGTTKATGKLPEEQGGGDAERKE
jgi:Spy/CpxP family protein refolding chaperone